MQLCPYVQFGNVQRPKTSDCVTAAPEMSLSSSAHQCVHEKSSTLQLLKCNVNGPHSEIKNKLFMFPLMFNYRVDTEMNCHITGSLIPPHTGCMRWLSVHDPKYASELKRSGYTNSCFSCYY